MVRFTLELLRRFFVIACLFGIATSSTHFQPFSQLAQAQEFEEEREDEEDDGDEEVEGFDELLYVREMLSERLEELKEETAETRQRLQSVDDFLGLVKKAGKIEEQIAAAEAKQDDAEVERLTKQFERFEQEIDLRDDLLRLEYQIMEAMEELREAEREEDEERLEFTEVLLEGLYEIRSITNKLVPIYLDGPESKEGPLEERKALVYTNRVEKTHRAMQLLEEIEEAEQEDDDDLVEELEEKLETLRDDIESFGDKDEGAEADEAQNNETDKATTKRAASNEPKLDPILVTEATLAPFAAMDLHRDVAPLLKHYCFDCHSNEESSGELNFEKLLAVSPIVMNREQWVNVIEQSKNHVMPPEDAKQPSIKERKAIVLALHNAVYKFDYSKIDDPGFESARRLTHREYSNTVRDLFGINIDVVDRFPDDLTATSGFDNSSNSLFIQPLLMERYIGIAEHVVDAALPDSSINKLTAEQQSAHARIFIAKPTKASETVKVAKQVMQRFLLRAYRRPPTKDELSRFSSQIQETVAGGASFEVAVKATLQTVLITPSFLILAESSRPNSKTAFAINHWELASRLSYFLWASMPDDKLLRLAAANKLSEPSILSSQVVRMLDDPKADTLGTVFAAQWLGSQHLGVRTRLDPIDNPWCTETLMTSMRDETSMFFNTLVRENRPITELVNADYTFLNQELAKLYGIRGVKGEQMRRVSLETEQRGGIFGQGSLLAVTSFPGRTSPVVRGKWVLDTVLGTPPPPPPPNVSELSDEIEGKRRLSFREKLELHREKPNCYACHSEMDPLGFSLENYDWFGRYRTRRGRGRVDSKGELPNGTKFEGLAGLKKVVVEQRKDDLVRQVTQKLLSYALGRQLEYYDEPAIQKILAKVGGSDDKLQSLVHEIVLSYPFRFKQNRPAKAETAQSRVSPSNVGNVKRTHLVRTAVHGENQ